MNQTMFAKTITVAALALGAAGASLFPSTTHAAPVSVNGGTLTMDLYRDAWALINLGTPSVGLYDGTSLPKPGLYLEEFYDQSQSASLNYINSSFHLIPGLAEIPATGLQFAVNGSSVTNLGGHHDQPTNFNFDTADLTGTAAGSIGLGGVLRTRGNFGGGLFVLGEFDLKYDASRIGTVPDASGWVLTNHVSNIVVPAFDLINATSSVGANSLTLSGDLRATPDLASSFFNVDGGDGTRTLGTITLQATTVPVPAAVWLFGSALAGLGVIRRRKAEG